MRLALDVWLDLIDFSCGKFIYVEFHWNIYIIELRMQVIKHWRTLNDWLNNDEQQQQSPVRVMHALRPIHTYLHWNRGILFMCNVNLKNVWCVRDRSFWSFSPRTNILHVTIIIIQLKKDNTDDNCFGFRAHLIGLQFSETRFVANYIRRKYTQQTKLFV